ncbi:hypothetical protein NDU88_006957 [Pleurodeles waltl]|uniref:Uncharacterized protein n=1 Tax=Pleurodeles waltl TaxID=8319 RepID=A0AAV7SR21_PLEWA|nr:hypothetical protein NDU88_006957 [Pleurodeles waltl]
MGDPLLLSMLELKNSILECNRAITEKTDGVATAVTLLRQDLDKMRNRVKYLGTGADRVDEIVGSHATTLTDHERSLKMQEAKLEDVEDRSQRNNVHILGLPEGTESIPVEQFLESWLPTVLPGLESEGGLQVDEHIGHKGANKNQDHHHAC